MHNVEFVMDGFHLKNFKKQFYLEGAWHYAEIVRKAINSKGLEAFVKYCDATSEKQANEALGECHDWSIFENVCQGGIMSGKLMCTTFILKALGKMQPIGSVALFLPEDIDTIRTDQSIDNSSKIH